MENFQEQEPERIHSEFTHVLSTCHLQRSLSFNFKQSAAKRSLNSVARHSDVCDSFPVFVHARWVTFTFSVRGASRPLWATVGGASLALSSLPVQHAPCNWKRLGYLLPTSNCHVLILAEWFLLLMEITEKIFVSKRNFYINF